MKVFKLKINFYIRKFFILPIPLLGQKKILKGEMGRVIDKKLDEKIQKQQDEIHELQNIINDLRGVNREVRNFVTKMLQPGEAGLKIQ